MNGGEDSVELLEQARRADRCPLALLAGLREFSAIEWGTAGYTLAGRALGAALATVVLQVLSAPTLSILFALLILGGVALSVRGWVVNDSMVRIVESYDAIAIG